MRYAIQLVRSLVFDFLTYATMLVYGIIGFPFALYSLGGTYWWMHFYCRTIFWYAHWIVGIKTEVRGTPPKDAVLICAKHQSFLDILMIFSAVPRGKFIMKKEILYLPVIGWFGKRIGSAAVDRGKKAVAIQQMMKGAENNSQVPGQLIIYPQGTRVVPGVDKPYKIGAGALYERMGLDCVPVGTNVGLFWPRNGLLRYPGTAVVEFLPPIKAGKPTPEFMTELKTVIENSSNRLMAEAGFNAEA